MRKHHYLEKKRHLRSISFGVGVSLLGTSCLALQTYPLVDQQSTKVIISQKEQNRIAVLGDRIQQIFGAEGAFDVESDEEGGQIFLIAALSREARHGFSLSEAPPLIKPMTITIITEEGLTQDLKLIPKDIEAQSILFKPTLSLPLPEEHQETQKQNHLQCVINLLKAMVKNEELEGYTKTFFEKDPAPLSLRTTPFKSLKVQEILTYKGAHYKGTVYTLQNLGKEALSLTEADFVSPRDCAFSLSKTVVHPGETITLYVVTQKYSSQECATQECTRRES